MNKKNEKYEQQQEMEKKLKKLKRLLPLLLLLLGLVCIGIAQLTPDEKKANKELALQGESEGEPFHKEYSPDVDKEPFQENASLATVSDFTFSKPVDVSNLMEEQTNSVLTDVGERMKLFRAYGEVAYIYNDEENTRQVIGSDIPKAALCTNSNYVAYISEHEFRTPQIIPYEIGLGSAQALFTAPYNHKITAITCDEQHIYFTVESPEGNKTSQSVTFSEFQGKIRPSETSITVEHASDFLSKTANGVYVYLPGKNTFHHFNPYGTYVNDIPVHVKDSVSRFLQMKLNDNGDYVAVYYDQEMNLKGTINGEVLDDFLNLARAEWYDASHLLFLDTNTLYVYDTKKKEKVVLKTNVSDFVVSGTDLYFHDGTGVLYFLQRKTEE